MFRLIHKHRKKILQNNCAIYVLGSYNIMTCTVLNQSYFNFDQRNHDNGENWIYMYNFRYIINKEYYAEHNINLYNMYYIYGISTLSKRKFKNESCFLINKYCINNDWISTYIRIHNMCALLFGDYACKINIHYSSYSLKLIPNILVRIRKTMLFSSTWFIESEYISFIK